MNTVALSREETEELTGFAVRLADAAAGVTLQHFRQPVAVDDKDGGDGFDPVTQADREAEQAIRALIEAHYPDHQIFGEEYGLKETGSAFEWVLDPIDGTRAFISGLPTWGTLIGLKYEGTPVIGVIDQPYIKERYVGWTSGATLNGRPIKTRPCTSLAQATVSTTDPALFGPGERERFERILAETRLVRYGLDCYAYAVLANGFMDLVIESGLKPYDMMALIPVIRGAGGSATNWQGHAPGDCGRIVALGDPALLDTVLEIIGDIDLATG